MCYFIDSHCHLTDGRYGDAAEVVKNAKDLGVNTLIDVGWDAETSKKAKSNAEKYNGVYFSAGIHPSESLKPFENSFGFIEELLSHDKCVALGEVGLDYHYDGVDREKQKRLFESQIFIADRYNLPLIIHSRDASMDMLDILTANKNHLSNGVLMHCYSESKEQAKCYLDLGAYFAFGGVITFKNSKKDDIVRFIPKDRIMAETDSPYMAPEPLRGTLNEPCNVTLVYKKLSEIYGENVSETSERLKKNFARFFKKVRL